MHAMDILLAALKARLPGLHLRTLEEARALQALRQAVAALSGQLVPRVLWRWSSASGLQVVSFNDEEPERPLQDPCGLEEALNAFRKTQENVVLALLDPWAELANPIFVRALREALAHARGTGKAIVLVGRGWKIPSELQADLFIADLPLPTHELFGQGTVCTLKFDGGYRQYEMVVPARCEMVINRLLMPGETRETAVSDLRALIDQLGLASTVTIETPPPFFNPYFLDQSTPLLPVFNQAYAQVVGRPPHFAPHNGITDVNVFTAEGNIPTIAFGPKGARHHMAGEYVELATLEKVARVYAETAVSFLSNR